jgi:uncharacterized protein with NRDE domain
MDFKRTDRYRYRIDFGIRNHAKPLTNERPENNSLTTFFPVLLIFLKVRIRSMCLIALAWQTHPDYPILMVSNRDEFYARATQSMDFWTDKPDILAGRDLEAGGTWLGISKKGRIAALTNVREQPEPRAFSRGHLVTAWLEGTQSPQAFKQWLQDKGDQLAGHNLLFGNVEQMFWATNRPPGSDCDTNFSAKALAPGIHSLSNASLNTPWPKVELAKQQLQAAIGENEPLSLVDFCSVTANRDLHSDLSYYEDKNLGAERLLALSAQWIHTPDYGTRATTVIRRSTDGTWECLEQTFNNQAQLSASAEFAFEEQEPPS